LNGVIVIVGGGPLGGAVAHKLATRDRVSEIRLIDSAIDVAQGKALDIRQSAPIDRFSTRITAADSMTAAAGAAAIIIADDASSQQEHSGEPGLAVVRQLLRADADAPIVCGGATQIDLIARGVGELRAPRRRLLGSAPVALESALRAIIGLPLDISGAEVSLRVLGRPPRAIVVAWEEATASGMLLSSQLAAHQIAGISARAAHLWPPGPYSLASAAARVVEAIVNGSRRRFSCFVSLDKGATRNAVAAMPVELDTQGIARVLQPGLTQQEQTMLENAME
jgi:malate dehydrogenase